MHATPPLKNKSIRNQSPDGVVNFLTKQFESKVSNQNMYTAAVVRQLNFKVGCHSKPGSGKASGCGPCSSRKAVTIDTPGFNARSPDLTHLRLNEREKRGLKRDKKSLFSRAFSRQGKNA